MASRHISGKIDDKDCLACHDHSQHQNGVVNLVDPHSGAAEPWDGTRTEFCLTCHDDDPPKGISFPANTSGSGYDKCSFADSAHAKWLGDQSCSHCHNSHGSPYRSLLKVEYAASGNYAACWVCHDESRIITERNSFEKLHEVHVIAECVHCLVCHDVHGAYDSGEPGLIHFRRGKIQDGFNVEFIESRSASTAFEIDSSRKEGACYIGCHQDGNPRKYLRAGKTHTVTCLGCH